MLEACHPPALLRFASVILAEWQLAIYETPKTDVAVGRKGMLCLSFPTITSPRYFTSPEGFSSSGEVWYASGEVVLTREA